MESAGGDRVPATGGATVPILLTRLAEGDVTLTSISLLAGHLTGDNHESSLDAARHASRRDVERLVASLHAQPDIPASVRRVPSTGERLGGGALVFDDTKRIHVAVRSGSDATASPPPAPVQPPAPPTRPASRPAVAPRAADRYLLRLTIDAATHAKLERARDLLRHSIPNGDPALIVNRALTFLVEQLEKRKAGHVLRPVRPRRAHNAYEATRWFGENDCPGGRGLVR